MVGIAQHSQTAPSYDDVPYESFPFDQTHPQRLYIIGTLFGMTPVDFRKARVLELGCSMGGNILPLAYQYPESTFVGIDLSETQIAMGNRDIEALGLNNITLLEKNIMDFSEADGHFDYIIAHGVLSWIPQPVQEKLLEICKKNLSPNGIAFISYNTLPGWNLVRTFSDMMRYHTERFTNPLEKARHARGLLQFVKETASKKGSFYHEALQTELNLLNSSSDSYLLHDHLETHNTQFYFHEFMAMAEKHDLQYLGDAHAHTMFSGNLPPKVAEMLNTSNDLTRIEQYMDFVNNRRFRNTLLCHKDVHLTRSIQVTDINKFYIKSLLKCAKSPEKVNIYLDNDLKFIHNHISVATSTPGTTAILLTLQENAARLLSADEVVTLASQKLKATDTHLAREALYELGIRLYLSGSFLLYAEPGRHVTTLSEKPQVFEVARHQAAKQPWVCNTLHQWINIDELARIVILNSDGQSSLEHITEIILQKLEKGEISLSLSGQGVENPRKYREEIHQLVKGMLILFSQSALLIA